MDQDRTGHADFTGKGRIAFCKMRIAPYTSTIKRGTKLKTRRITPLFFVYGGYMDAKSHSKHILLYRNLTLIQCTPSLVIRVNRPEIFIGILAVQEMLLSNLRFSLVYILLFLPTKIQRQNAKYKCRANLLKLSFQVGSRVCNEMWQQI